MILLAAFLISLVISLVFFPIGYKGSPFGAIALFFGILFLAVLASGFWIVPFGPALWGVYWLPLAITGIFFAFLLLLPPPTRSVTRKENVSEETTMAISGFVWILLIGLFIAVVAGYNKNRVDENTTAMTKTEAKQ
ncbi:MAG TPA: hypothetical protein VD905_16885 [Flavobacteriales bacterium]|nr:hypothetical protein [Flavobacteriales bacterium]